MTLILTAVCGDGVAICADKRRTIKTRKKTEYFDDLDKIYRFSDSRTLAFNHAINRLCGKDWRSCVSDFEAECSSAQLTCKQLADEFAYYIDDAVIEELNHNRFDECVGFVFCTVRQSTDPAVWELFWKVGQTIEKTPHVGLVRTGHGAKYLGEYLEQHATLNTPEYWLSLGVSEAAARLQELFEMASLARMARSEKNVP